MKKLISVLLVLCLSLPLLFTQGATDREEEPDEIIKMILALSHSETDPWAQGNKVFAEELEKISGGTMKVECFFGGQLYSPANILPAIKQGRIDFTGFGMRNLDEAPYLGMFGAAYMFRDADHAQNFYSSDMGKKIFDDIEDKVGIRLLDTAYVGSRHVSLSRELPDIKKPEDLRGVSLRMPGGDSWAHLARSIGATPVPIAVTEIYMAMRTGIVDGQDNAIPSLKSASIDELLDQVSLTQHVIWNLHLAVNADRWNSFTEKQKEWVREAAALGVSYTTEIYKTQEEELKKEFADQGIRIVEPDRQAFIDYAENYYKNNTDATKYWNWEYYDALKNQ